ncbi:sulfotransferase [Sphingomonas flavalba]|uniref:tetratricopeptide repeat-containing sulfotransferase family protein n=1 Tax=Sphingomonas flavalba TaxID=2559804 RepID=UPI0039E001E7
MTQGGGTGRQLFEQGLAHERAGDFAGAFDAFRQSAKADPTVAAPYVGLARILVRNHQRDEAIACLERAVAYEPGHVAAWTALGRTLAEDGRLDAARKAYDAVLARTPAAPGALLGRAALFEDLGDRAQAADAYRRLLAAQPDHVEALAGLVGVAEDGGRGDAVALAQARLATADDRDAALLGYAIGKALARGGDADTAFAAMLAANAARRRDAGPFNRAVFDRRVAALTAMFSPAFLAARRDWGDESERPVFIVGLPRSGTTLTEQILSGHPAVFGAGELDMLTDLATALPDRIGPGTPPWPEAAASLSRDQTMAVADAILARLDSVAPGRADRVIDKQPLNFWHLGLVAMTLPNARVINCTRDIRDGGLSIFSENFTPEQQWATDLADIAHYQLGYQRLINHWKAATTLPVLDVRYEALVGDLEGEARRILAFLGLPWDPAVLRFHEQDRAVQTPSRWQVRQPIYRSSSGRWRAYARHIGPLIAAAGDDN